MLFLEHVTQHK